VAAPRCQASIDRARRLPEARPPVALASRLGGQRTGPIFIYTLHRHELVHRGFEPAVPRLQLGPTGGARCDRCRQSQSSERRSFAPTSSTSDLQHRDLSGGSDRSAKIADVRDSLIPPQSSLIAGLNSLLRRKNSLLGCVGNWPRKRLDQLTFSGHLNCHRGAESSEIPCKFAASREFSNQRRVRS
jgi:hypothetical protein